MTKDLAIHLANLDTAPHINDVVGAKREWLRLRKTMDDFIYERVNGTIRKEVTEKKKNKKLPLANNNLTGQPGAVTEVSEMPDTMDALGERNIDSEALSED